MWIYKQINSKKVEDIEKFANEQDARGWEFVQVVTAKDRYVSLFRKPRPPKSA